MQPPQLVSGSCPCGVLKRLLGKVVLHFKLLSGSHAADDVLRRYGHELGFCSDRMQDRSSWGCHDRELILGGTTCSNKYIQEKLYRENHSQRMNQISPRCQWHKKEMGLTFKQQKMLFPYFTKRKEVRGFGWLIGLCLGLAAQGEESCLWRRNTQRAENQNCVGCPIPRDI